jgi:hypothetical protein
MIMRVEVNENDKQHFISLDSRVYYYSSWITIYKKHLVTSQNKK